MEENYKPLVNFFVQEQEKYFNYVIDLIKDVDKEIDKENEDIEI